ncbi:MAG: hypothetical protein PHV68_00510 [Candidatus Gastranaerophilales bacterium]|nr:hypothetical protein [Candidatus Gastranaerophilales bacterium]
MLKILNFRQQNVISPVFAGKRKPLTDPNQICLFDNGSAKDVFVSSASNKTIVVESKSATISPIKKEQASPKEILIQKADTYLETEARLLLNKSPITGKPLLHSKDNLSKRSRLLEKLAADKLYYDIPHKDRSIFTDTILIRLHEKLDDDDKLKDEVFSKLSGRVVLSKICNPKKDPKMYYTRMSIINDVLLKDVMSDYNDLDKIVSSDKEGWFGSKVMKLSNYKHFIEINEYHDKYKLKKIKDNLTLYKKGYETQRISFGYPKEHPIEYILNGIIKNL